MNHAGIPQDIKEFLIQCIESVGQLEVLFCFYDHPEKVWTPEMISMELRSHPVSAKKQIESFQDFGLISKKDQGYIYQPRASLHDKVKHLKELYQQKPVAVVTFIYDKPSDKLKGFADAFKLKKD